MKKRSKYINFLLISLILSIITCIGIIEYKDNHIEKKESDYITNNISTIYNSNKEKINEHTNEAKINEQAPELEKKVEYLKEEVIKEYKGYDVLARLEIPAIDLKTYILKTYSTSALNVSVTKFWGANPNQIGNFCVAGHNFKNNNMFRNLKKLEIGNILTISDNNVGKINYKVYKIYTVLPDDITCLSQETNGNKEVTLITCTSDSSKRIIVKAREVKS